MKRLGFISLAEHNADLCTEWHSTKNGLLAPTDVHYNAGQKVWWKCSEGHEWEARLSDRVRGQGCPECAQGQRVITRTKNILERRGSLETNNPDLAMQWHSTKNAPLTPFDVTVNSAKRVWWQCGKGHEWDATICSRNAGSGCPVCSGYKVLVGYNDLLTVNPELAIQWHPTKNGELKPTDIIATTEKKAWWLGKCGHEWEASVVSRNIGSNCPICNGKKVLVGYNDLATVNPDVAAQWHPTKNGTLQPTDFVSNSNKKAWWQCSKGHEWRTAISHRNKGTQCPECMGEFKTSFPEQVIFFYFNLTTMAHNRYKVDKRTEIDVYLPDYKIGIEYDGIFYHKGDQAEIREENKEKTLKELGISLFRVKEFSKSPKEPLSKWIIYTKSGPSDAELDQMVKKLLYAVGELTNRQFSVDVNVARDRSKIYENYIRSEKENSLLGLNTDLAAEWHPTKNGKLLPEHVSVRSNKRVWWQCTKGHEWQAVINSRGTGVGCPFCAGKKAIIGQTDLETMNPEMAKEWHPNKNGRLTARDVTESSNKKVWWLCEKGHEWETAVYHRKRGDNCPFCSGRKVLAGFNDLGTVNTELADQWHPERNGDLSPSDVTAGSDKKVWWKCREGHEWEAVISSRSAGVNCPVCAGQKVCLGYNDLAITNPELAIEWHPVKNGELKPSSVIAGSNKKAWWLGKCGHEWEASISSRNSGRGCPICASQKLFVGFNDLATCNPELASEWHPAKNGSLTPSDVMPGSNKKVWWLCKKGHEWENMINARNRGRGCPVCAGQRVIVGYNDLATINPELAAQWHPTKNGERKPSDVMPATNKKAWWLGKCGHEWESVINARNSGVGCPYCAGKKTLQGYNDLATVNPSLAAEWHPTKNGTLKPTEYTRGSNKRFWWICPKGHEWEDTINSRSAGRECPICLKNKTKRKGTQNEPE